MYIVNPLCNQCKHACLNYGDGSGHGCRAFPNGIPEEAKGGYNHHKVLPGQVGEYVYELANYEDLSPFAKYLIKLEEELHQRR